jgi:hypothetical protein
VSYCTVSKHFIANSRGQFDGERDLKTPVDYSGSKGDEGEDDEGEDDDESSKPPPSKRKESTVKTKTSKPINITAKKSGSIAVEASIGVACSLNRTHILQDDYGAPSSALPVSGERGMPAQKRPRLDEPSNPPSLSPPTLHQPPSRSYIHPGPQPPFGQSYPDVSGLYTHHHPQPPQGYTPYSYTPNRAGMAGNYDASHSSYPTYAPRMPTQLHQSQPAGTYGQPMSSSPTGDSTFEWPVHGNGPPPVQPVQTYQTQQHHSQPGICFVIAYVLYIPHDSPLGTAHLPGQATNWLDFLSGAAAAAGPMLPPPPPPPAPVSVPVSPQSNAFPLPIASRRKRDGVGIGVSWERESKERDAPVEHIADGSKRDTLVDEDHDHRPRNRSHEVENEETADVANAGSDVGDSSLEDAPPTKDEESESEAEDRHSNTQPEAEEDVSPDVIADTSPL